MGNVTLAQVYAALTYYHANREEIEAYLDKERENYKSSNCSGVATPICALVVCVP